MKVLINSNETLYFKSDDHFMFTAEVKDDHLYIYKVFKPEPCAKDLWATFAPGVWSYWSY
jgi:hypothetical protein